MNKASAVSELCRQLGITKFTMSVEVDPASGELTARLTAVLGGQVITLAASRVALPLRNPHAKPLITEFTSPSPRNAINYLSGVLQVLGVQPEEAWATSRRLGGRLVGGLSHEVAKRFGSLKARLSPAA